MKTRRMVEALYKALDLQYEENRLYDGRPTGTIYGKAFPVLASLGVPGRVRQLEKRLSLLFNHLDLEYRKLEIGDAIFRRSADWSGVFGVARVPKTAKNKPKSKRGRR